MALSNNATSSIPIFVQNQILRADDLNQLVHYFEEQSRLSRIFTIGIGIVNGLELSFDSDGQLTISPGMGISSDGVLFELTKKCVITFYQATSISEKAFSCGEDNKQGPCFDEESAQISVLELFTDEQANELKDPKAFPPDDGIDEHPHYLRYVLVLLHCEEEENRKSCFNECEKKGVDLRSGTRVLLVPGSSIGCGVNEQTGGVASLAEPFTINRLSYGNGGLDLCKIETWELLYKRYFEQLVYTEIESVFSSANLGFYKKIFSGTTAKHFENLTVFFDHLVSGYDPNKLNLEIGDIDAPFIPHVSDIQYCYAFFRDLVLAYEEFYKLACGMNLEADINLATLSENRCKFPGYIALGTLGLVKDLSIKKMEEKEALIAAATAVALKAKLKECRTGFFPAGKRKNLLQERAVVLYERLVDMIIPENLLLNPPRKKILLPQIFKLNSKERKDIRITASCTQKFGLSHQAIPFYFKWDDLKTHWNADNPFCKKFPAPAHFDTSSIPNNENILLEKLDTFDFYRIEGHLGFRMEEARSNIELSRKKLNLPFDIRPLLIGPGVELDAIFQDENLLDWGELQEVYKNTRADVLRRIDELEPNVSTGSGPLSTFYNTLEHTHEVLNLKESAGDEFLEELGKAINSLTSGAHEELKEALNNVSNLFKNIFDDLNARVEDIKRALRFHTFAEDHPGMEHLGGVYSGGTFIIVYTCQFYGEESKIKTIEFLNNKIKDVPKDIIDDHLKEAIAAQKDTADLLNDAKNVINDTTEFLKATSDVLKDENITLSDRYSDEQLLIKAFNFISAFNFINAYHERKDNYLHLTEIFEVVTGDENPEERIRLKKVVVADFCLPYYCCTKSLTIRHEISEATPYIFIDREFCYDPKQNVPETIPLTLTPEGGNLKYYFGAEQLGDTIEDANADQQFEIKSFIDTEEMKFEDGKAEVSVRYNLLRQQTSKPFTVYRKPDTSLFTWERGTKLLDADCNWIGFTYEFSHKLNQGDNFAETGNWNFNDGNEVAIDFAGTDYERDLFIDENYQSQKKKVILEATNGICISDFQKIIDLCPAKNSYRLFGQCEIEIQYDEQENPFLANVVCNDQPLQPVADSVPEKYSFIQNDGIGFFSIDPEYFRGDFSIILKEGEVGGDVDISKLIYKDCVEINGVKTPVYLFIYYMYSLDMDRQRALKLDEYQQLRDLSDPIILEISFNALPCDLPQKFLVEIIPHPKISAPNKICFEKGMNPVQYTVSPPAGTVKYGIKESSNITTVDLADTNQSLNLEDFIDPNNDFVQGKLQVEIKYTYEENPADDALIEVYKKPEANQFDLVNRESLIENCEWTGFTFEMAHGLNSDEVSYAEWDFNGKIEDVDLNSSTTKYDFRFNPLISRQPVKIGLSAKNDECPAVSESKLFDFCPDDMKVGLFEGCIIKDNDDDAIVDEISCDKIIIPNTADPDTYVIKREEGQGYFEIRPTYPGGQFDVSLESGFMFPDDEAFPNSLIRMYCLPDKEDRSKLVYLFIYNWDLIDDDSNIKRLLDITNGPNFGLETTVTLIIKYSLSSPCNLSEEFKVTIELGQFDLSNINRAETKIEAKTKTTSAKPKKVATKKATAAKAAKAKPPKKTTPAKPTKKAMELLNARSAVQRERLGSLESDKALARSNPFGLAKSFLILPANELSKVNERFEEVLKSLIAGLGRAKGKRKTDLNKVTATLLHNYLDKQTLLSPAAMDPTTRDLLENQLPKLKQKNIRLGTVRNTWKGEELKKAFKAKAVDQFNDLLK